MNVTIAHLLGLLIVLSPALRAEKILNLSDADRLRRLSLITRGHVPSPDEITALGRVGAIDRPAYLSQRARVYVGEPDFATKMVNNLSYLFRVAPPGAEGRDAQYTTLHLLFDKVVTSDLRWDDLLVSSTVDLTDQGSDTGRGSVDFFRNAATPDEGQALSAYLREMKLKAIGQNAQPESSSYNWISKPGVGPRLDFKSGQVAGVLSDPHFNARFPTNPINQNRKRAAAVFRIFLCDDMQAVTLPDEAVQNDLDVNGFENKAAAAPVGLHADVHASDPKCSSCHYKLDPLANVFRGVSTKLPNRPAAGALTFKRRTGELVNIPFTNARDLARALVRQPEYASCQVRHFWDWFVGEDVVMNQQTEDELLREFDRVGRRPREFARYLINRPEFASFPVVTAETININHVGRTLMDCTSCHTTEKAAPDYRQVPFTRFGISVPPEKTQMLHDFNLQTMVETLDLTGDGSKVTMPPANAGWRLSSDERSRLLVWLANGARDADGRVTWQDQGLREKLTERARAENISFTYRPTQGFTARRRQTTGEVSASLNVLTNQLGLPALSLSGTRTDEHRINLTSGTPLKSVGASYVQMVSSDARAFSSLVSFRLHSDENFAARLGLPTVGMASNDAIITSLTQLIWGRAVVSGTPEWTKLSNFLRPLASETVAIRVDKLAYQLIISDKFLVF